LPVRVNALLSKEDYSLAGYKKLTKVKCKKPANWLAMRIVTRYLVHPSQSGVKVWLGAR
jgi:hypothetical protein